MPWEILQIISNLNHNADMPAYATLRRLGEISEDQWGFVTRRQAESAGVSRATIARLSAAGSEPAILERVASGVYRLRGVPLPDHSELRAGWLQLAPDVPAWQRTAAQGVVSHRSAASLYGLGHLPADRHEFTLGSRRQARRADVRLHIRQLREDDWVELSGLPVARPARIAADLLSDGEDLGAVAQVIADAIGQGLEQPAAFAEALGAHAARFGLDRGDGVGLLAWLLDVVGAPDANRWVRSARARGRRPARPTRSGPAAPPARTLADALAVVSPFIDPLLAGTAAGRWDPVLRAWTT
jgi:predicted transcriptional regulator of viral defense system